MQYGPYKNTTLRLRRYQVQYGTIHFSQSISNEDQIAFSPDQLSMIELPSRRKSSPIDRCRRRTMRVRGRRTRSLIRQVRPGI